MIGNKRINVEHTKANVSHYGDDHRKERYEAYREQKRRRHQQHSAAGSYHARSDDSRRDEILIHQCE